MRLNPKALALTSAAWWGVAVLCVGLVNLAQPTYGVVFLQCLASVYPGYHAMRTIGDVLTVTGYAMFDGGIAGWLFGWLYNRLIRSPQ